MKKPLPKEFFERVRKEATKETHEYDPKTCVMLSEEDVIPVRYDPYTDSFISADGNKIRYGQE